MERQNIQEQTDSLQVVVPSDQKDVKYFREILKQEIERLSALCASWRETMSLTSGLAEESNHILLRKLYLITCQSSRTLLALLSGPSTTLRARHSMFIQPETLL